MKEGLNFNNKESDKNKEDLPTYPHILDHKEEILKNIDKYVGDDDYEKIISLQLYFKDKATLKDKENLDEIEREIEGRELVEDLESLNKKKDTIDKVQNILDQIEDGDKSYIESKDIFSAFYNDFGDFDYLENKYGEKLTIEHLNQIEKEELKGLIQELLDDFYGDKKINTLMLINHLREYEKLGGKLEDLKTGYDYPMNEEYLKYILES